MPLASRPTAPGLRARSIRAIIAEPTGAGGAEGGRNMAEAPKTQYTPRERVVLAYKGGFTRLEIPDPKRHGRLPAFLEQCAALTSAGLPSALGAVLVGPWTIAMLMRNPELMCLDTIDDPQFVHDLMGFTTEYAKRVGDAVLETRIGLSYSDPTASCSLVGPDTYREFIKPYHKALVDHFTATNVATTAHFSGTTHQIHEDPVDVGFVAVTIDLDQQSDPALKVDQLDKLVTL